MKNINNKWLILGLVLTVLTLTGKAYGAGTGQFVQDRDTFVGTLKKVSIMAVIMASDFSERDDARQEIERLTILQLQEAGIEVVPAARYREIFNAKSREAGGVFDPITGKSDDVRWKEVSAATRKALVETEGVNGFALLAVEEREAPFYRFDATWDGASDTAYGKTGLWASFNSPELRGKLPALSLRFGLYDASYKLAYVGRGGIQLQGYSSNSYGGYVEVAKSNLLRDTPRLSRAISLSTLELRKSPSEIAADEKASKKTKKVELPPQADPASNSGPVQNKSRDYILQRVHTVVLRTGGTNGPNGDVHARYEAAIRAELAPLGWRIISESNYRQLTEAEEKAHGGYYDRYTGENDLVARKASRQRVLAELGREGAVDAVLTYMVLPRKALNNGGDTMWDGVRQNAVDFGPWRKFSWSEPRAGVGDRGTIPALSLAVRLEDMDTNVYFFSVGGIHLLQRLDGDSLQDLPKGEWLADKKFDAVSTHIALRGLVLEPKALEEESNPKK